MKIMESVKNIQKLLKKIDKCQDCQYNCGNGFKEDKCESCIYEIHYKIYVDNYRRINNGKYDSYS